MTFKHKLARRLARGRETALAVTLVLLAAGCGSAELKGGLDPQPPGSPAPPPPGTPPPQGVPQHVNIDSVLYTENGDGTYGVAVHYTPDIALDSLYVRVWLAEGSWQGLPAGPIATRPNPQLFTLPCAQVGHEIQSRSYRAGLRSDPMLRDARTFVCGSPAPPPGSPPPPPPPPGSNLSLDFDDPNNLGLNCALQRLGGNQCPNWFTSGWRKHSYLPSGGANGTGAINMHWFTGMSIGFSPIWVDPVAHSRHFRVRYAVKQTAPMVHAGSGQKLHRIRSDNTFIGTLLSHQGAAQWYWEGWTSNAPVSPVNLGFNWPTDGQWHIYDFELDYRDVNDMVFTFWLDGLLMKIVHRTSLVGDLMAGDQTLTFSPFAEMYSCGDSGACSSGINTGDYTVDDFTVTFLP